ncbi:DUF6169 family protein [Flavobacterium sp.]|uniref:DUF6169 family protein n=1 Tax=Flavobacterium sp. TaxID=239 RepID=UPI0022BC77BF|nr:DUF6169 family protein [Flavobacterium sp.]MCZ8144273.1 DUF6169 family protein [Flavobacterium sp.]MCZ8367641.1 DUF6169 family protein [Flavobacterium sp.]
MPNRYSYTFNEDTSTYNFTTKNNIEYKVVFIIDETLDSVSENAIENVYQVIIEKVSDAIEPFDSAVGRTIDNIIKSFFENAQNSLIYICSEDEEKAEIRFNVFDRWYLNSTFNKFVTKIDNVINFEVNGETYLLYTSLLYHNDNPNIEYVLTAYNSIEEVLNSK